MHLFGRVAKLNFIILCIKWELNVLYAHNLVTSCRSKRGRTATSPFAGTFSRSRANTSPECCKPCKNRELLSHVLVQQGSYQLSRNWYYTFGLRDPSSLFLVRHRHLIIMRDTSKFFFYVACTTRAYLSCCNFLSLICCSRSEWRLDSEWLCDRSVWSRLFSAAAFVLSSTI